MTVLVESGHINQYPYNHARILWNNVITSISATGAATGNPASAALTKTTYERWKPTTSGDVLTGTFSAQEINSIAIAAHSDLTPTVEVLQGSTWEPITAFPFDGESLDASFADGDYRLISYAPDNEAILFLIKPRICSGVRITVTYSGTAPTLGVLMAGQVLEMQRPFYSGHSPSLLSSQSTVRPNISESGEWLGASQIRQGRNVAMSWENLKAPWVRKNFMPFSEALLTNPFVAAWNPKRFPDAVYCSSSERPQPSNSGTLNYQNITLNARAYSDGTTPEVLALASSTFDELFTFTRSSAATEVGPSGQPREVGTDVARFTHDPLTGEALGLLIEEERTNLLEGSRELANPDYWDQVFNQATPNAAKAVDGTLNATRLNVTSSGPNRSKQNLTISGSTTYTFSALFKKGQSTEALLRLRDSFATDGLIVFDTNDGSISVSSGDDFGLIDYGEWWRAYVVSTSNGTSAEVRIEAGGEDQDIDWAQLEEGSFPTSIIVPDTTFTSRSDTAWAFDSAGTLQSFATDVARDDAYGYDSDGVLRFIGLLLEEASTNLLLNSDAPATQSVTVTDATVYTLSVYGSGSAEITIGGSGTATLGNPLTFTSSGTTVEVTVTGSLDYFQLEELEYATSPIVTSGTSVTRPADVSSSSASTRAADDCVRTLGAEFNAEAFTVYVEVTPLIIPTNGRIFEAAGSNSDNRILVYVPGSDTFGLIVRFNSSNLEVFVSSVTATAGETYKIAITYQDGVASLAVNGEVFERTFAGPYNVSAISQLIVGNSVGGNDGLTGEFKDLQLYPRALTATELQELTS